MFRWYQNATVCYAYLSDVSIETSKISETGYLHSRLESSRWFKRGWTLQELIAPVDATIYCQEWKCIGRKRGLV